MGSESLRGREREMGDGKIMELPEGCISDILSLTSPRDCCRSAAVSSTFRSAADSDTAWDGFLPSDLSEILSRAVDTVDFDSKKDLYFRLCGGVLVDGAKMIFSLEMSTGRRCYTLSARELTIVWGGTTHYWTWVSHKDSRFPEVAELVHVCWLEIRGKLDCRILSQGTNYAAYLIFKISERSYNLTNQEALVRMGGQVSKSKVCLQPDDEAGAQEEEEEDEDGVEETRVVGRAPCRRHDGWMEMELGEFLNVDGDDGEVEMSLMGKEGFAWKRGLIVEGIEVRPK